MPSVDANILDQRALAGLPQQGRGARIDAAGEQPDAIDYSITALGAFD